jgi:hypothetical protein
MTSSTKKENLFRIEPNPSELRECKDYSKYEERLKELDGKGSMHVETLGAVTHKYASWKNQGDEKSLDTVSWNIYGAYAGNPKADNRVLITGGMHGEEPAGVLAALEACKELSRPETALGKMLENTYFMVVPTVDPEGYDFKGRKFVDRDGVSDPEPMKGGKSWEDLNGCWGRRLQENLPDELKIIRPKVDEFKPTLHFDLHETVYGRSMARMGGSRAQYNMTHGNRQGLMILQSLPEGMADNAGLGNEILGNIRERGHKTYTPTLLYKILLPIISKNQLPQTIPLNKDYSLAKIGPLISEAGIKVASMYVSDKFGAQSYTFETFENLLDERVAEHLAGIEGALKTYTSTHRLANNDSPKAPTQKFYAQKRTK